MARPAPASTRAATIISFLTAHPLQGFTISELVQHLGMNIASAHATLAVLSDCGFVLRDPVHRTYALGPALAATGFAALERHPSIGAAIAQAEVLAAELECETGVTAAAGRDIVILAQRGPEPAMSGIGYPGDRSPLLAPMGAPFLAWADDGAVTAWLERAAVGPPLDALYRRILAQVRGHGFSVATSAIAAPAVVEAMSRLRAEPTDDGAEQNLTEVLQATDEMLVLFDGLSDSDEIVFKAIAAPVFDPTGRALLALSITGSGEPVRVDRVLALGRRLVRAAGIATRRSRGRVPRRDAHHAGTEPADALGG
ncbi:helix-turn-helix domain-containing protein [Actinomadura napierensis]|uniref:Helix-turn-helix domain-containing protein n=1 Tax=Actinomadura napierensis TaxID=267854 RepID=A0ABN2Y7C1_9ACTN